MNADQDDTIVDDEDFEVNMGEVEASKFEALPQGDYNAVIASLEYGRSQSANKPMWTAQLEVTDGEYTGRKVYTHLSFSPAAMPITKAALATFAPEYNDVAFKPKEVADNGDLLGKNVRVRLTIKTYEGRKSNQVKRWLPPAAQNNEFING